ncbi:unnamed protein product, partial [Allacma fusca]
MLGVQRFNTVTHKASDIIREMRKVMARFEITSKQVWRSLTDGASKMICSHRIDKQIFCPRDSRTTSDFHRQGSDKESDNSSGDDSAENARSEEEIPEGISEIDQVGEQILKILTEDLVKETGVGLVSFWETRWNYVYLVLERLLRVETEVNSVLKNNGKLKYVLKSEDWDKIKQIAAFLKPFHDYTCMVSKEKDAVSTEVIVAVLCTYVVLTLLDPRFRLMPPSDQRALGIQFLLNEYKLIISEETESNTNIANETRSETPLMHIKSRFPLVQEMKQAILSSQPLRENHSVLKFEAELNKYLSDSDYDNCMEDMD